MKITILAVCLALATATTAAAELTFFEHDNFNGRRFSVNGSVNNLGDTGFNDRASSVVVGSGTWQLCDDAYFRGNCVTLKARAVSVLAVHGHKRPYLFGPGAGRMGAAATIVWRWQLGRGDSGGDL